MKIVAFNGAMRGKHSITHKMITAVFEGAQQAGAEVEECLLVKHKIKHCTACMACWVKTPGVCRQKDDMTELLQKYRNADIAIIASPLYVDHVTGLMKAFLDRLIPTVDPHFALDENGESGHVDNGEPRPGFVMMSNCGYPEQSHFEILRLWVRRVARNMNGHLVAEIYRGGGGLLGVDNPMVQPIVDGYLDLLRTAGEEIVKNQGISDDTQEALERQLVPTELYIDQTNKLWDRVIRSAEEKREKKKNKKKKNKD